MARERVGTCLNDTVRGLGSSFVAMHASYYLLPCHLIVSSIPIIASASNAGIREWYNTVPSEAICPSAVINAVLVVTARIRLAKGSHSR